MKFSDKQKEWIKEATHRYNLKVGAVRSGKTYLDLIYTIPKRIRERKGSDGLNIILGVTKETIERNILQPMREVYGEELVGTINSRNMVSLFGDIAYCLGAEKINQVSKIRGSSIKYCYCDEMVEYNREVFELLKSRLDKENSCLDGCANPSYPTHWVKEFIDSNADIYTQEYNIDDNPFLPKEFVDNLKKEYAGTVYYNRYILGQWCNAEGMIYINFDRENIVIKDWYSKDVEGKFNNPIRKRIKLGVIGVDFGGNKSSTTFNCTVYTEGFKEMITAREKRIKKELTPTQLENELYDFIKLCQSEYIIRECYCDSAEQVLINGIKVKCMGLPIAIKNAKKGQIVDRIRFYISMIAQHRYYIVNDCKETTEAFEQALWSDKIDDTRLDDGTSNIDSLDSQEYSSEVYQDIMIVTNGK